MRMHEVISLKRKALGLTQAELGSMAGVSSGTVSAYEEGKTTSEPVVRCIIRAIDDKMNSLSKEEYFEVMLTKSVLELPYVEGDEKRRTLSYIIKWASQLNIEMYNM